MKRKISLFLALVMLLGCFAGLTAVAEGETPAPAAYQPEIAYTNVAYTEGIVLMFAVNAPAELPEGAKLELLVWGGLEDVTAFSANDAYVETITESVPVTIGEASYLAFKYDELSADMMTDIVYARPLYTDADGNRTYGDIVDYSVVEYVKVANGEFEGFAGLAEEKKNLLNSLLNFGGAAQKYLSGEETAYAPNGYLANDTLNKIWIVPVVNGVEQEKVFGGFFVAGADKYATLNYAYYDEYVAVGWLDGEGKLYEDADGDDENGFQIAAAAEGDLTVKCAYERKGVIKTDVNSKANVKVSSLDAAKNQTFTNTGDFAFNISYSYKGDPDFDDGGEKTNGYHSLAIIDDPYNEGEKVYKWAASELSAIYPAPAGSGIKVKNIAGFGDTLDTVITIELEVGRNEYGHVMDTGVFRLRADTNLPGATKTSQVNFAVFAISRNGQVLIPVNNAIDATNGIVVGTIPETGYGKFAITVDFNDGSITGYAKDENGNMVCTGTSSLANANYDACHATYADDDTSNDIKAYDSLRSWILGAQAKIEWFGTANKLSAEEMAELVDTDGDGVGDTALTTDGVINEAALSYLTEKYNSLLIKSLSLVAGDIYGE